MVLRRISGRSLTRSKSRSTRSLMPPLETREYNVDRLNPPDDNVRRFVDSTAAVAFARLFMPVALAVIGFFMVTTLSDIKAQIVQIWASNTKLNEDFQRQAISLAGVRVKV